MPLSWLHEHALRRCSPHPTLGRIPIHEPAHAWVDADTGLSELIDAHSDLEIDETTADSHWGGEAMDYDWVVGSLIARNISVSTADSTHA